MDDDLEVSDSDNYGGYTIKRTDYLPDMCGQSLYRYVANRFGMLIDELFASDATLPLEEETATECFDRLCESGYAIKNGEFSYADSGELKLCWTIGNPHCWNKPNAVLRVSRSDSEEMTQHQLEITVYARQVGFFLRFESCA